MRNAGVHLLAHLHRCRRPTRAIRRPIASGASNYTTRSSSQTRNSGLFGAGGTRFTNPCRLTGQLHIFCGEAHGIHSGVQEARAPARWETYDPVAFAKYYRYRPFSVAFRAMMIVSEIMMLTMWHWAEKDIRKRADKLRRSLIRLGPFYIKLGQALSTRPDILPNDYCLELAKLQDRIPPFPTPDALRFLEDELGSPAWKVFNEISDEPIAAASLGQVYRAQLHSGEAVAVKVQRPGVPEQLALDAHLLRLLGGQLQRFAGTRGDLVAVVDEMVGHMFEEVDYLREGQNAERFSRLFGIRSPTKRDRLKKPTDPNSRSAQADAKWEATPADPYGDAGDGVVKVPKIYWDYTTKGVLTMEWIEGIKLTDRESLLAAKLDIRHLVDQGVLSSLRQLLEEGYFHADPHPGNVVVTKEGVLAYFDFGMMSEFRREYRIGLIRTLIHFVNRDSEGLAKDFVMLDFIPVGTDLEPIAHELRESFGDEGTKSQLDFQGIMNQLWTVMYKFNFRLSPEYAMVVRALGSLEGTATTLDPGFKVVASAYPFIVGRLLADPDPQMRETLRELLIRNNGSIRWHRLERLVIAVADQSKQEGGSSPEEGAWDGQDGLGHQRAGGIRGAFDTRAVASATLDVLSFILSGEGLRVRILLVKDIVRTVDALLKHYYLNAMDLEKEPLYAEFVETKVRAEATSGVGQLDQDPKVESRSMRWKAFTLDAYGNNVFTNPLSWSKARLSRLWGARQGLWSSNKKDTEHKTTSSSEGPELAGQRAHISGTPDLGTPNNEQRHHQRVDEDPIKTPQFDDLPERLQAGLLAFAKAVKSDPEVWIPLMARLAAMPEARALGYDVASALADSYSNRTAEAAFLYISRQLHKQA